MVQHSEESLRESTRLESDLAINIVLRVAINIVSISFSCS